MIVEPGAGAFFAAESPVDPPGKAIGHSTMYRRGTTVEILAKHFQRTRSMMRRAFVEMRAQRLVSLNLDCISNPDFDKASLAAELLAPMPDVESLKPNAAK